MGIFTDLLPEAISGCLQTCNNVALLLMYYMCILAFTVTGADTCKLRVYLLIYCPRLFVVVYKLSVTLYCIASASYS